MKHYGNQKRTLSDILAQLQQELVTTTRLNQLTTEELCRRYSRLKPQVIEAELNHARKRAALSPQEAFAQILGEG